MTIRRMDHVGVVVDDLDAATAFFVALGLEVGARWLAAGEDVDRVVGLVGVRAQVAMLAVPGAGGGRLELSQFDAPAAGPPGDERAPANTPGLRHLSFEVDHLDGAVAAALAHGGALVGSVERVGERYRLCYLRGPAGIIVELAEAVG